MDKRNPVCAVFCDMTQAFDYVDHKILLRKLEAYGIRGTVLNLLKSYLVDRMQYTEITKINIISKKEETYISSKRSPQYGVPQGSVLGPLLFILYINDLPLNVDQPMTLFADDSTITITCKNKDTYEQDINNSLTSLIIWLERNNLKINLDKTHVMYFKQRTNTTNDIIIQYKNQTVNEVDSTKFLGINIDKQLNWKVHIQNLSKRLSTTSYALYKLTSEVNTQTLLTAYHGLVASILRYGIIFWGNSTDKDIIFIAQKRCIRAMFSIKSTESCKPLFKKHHILTVPSLYIFEIALFVKTNSNLFPRLSDKSSRIRRDGSKLCLHTARTSHMMKSVFCMAPVIYNKIPHEIKDMNVHMFKKKLLHLLAEKCYYKVCDFINDKF